MKGLRLLLLLSLLTLSFVHFQQPVLAQKSVPVEDFTFKQKTGNGAYLFVRWTDGFRVEISVWLGHNERRGSITPLWNSNQRPKMVVLRDSDLPFRLMERLVAAADQDQRHDIMQEEQNRLRVFAQRATVQD